MADDNKNSGFGSNTAILIALLASGAFWYARQAPLETSRPAPIESRVEARFSDQDVDARLWQDPFEAIAKDVKKAHQDGYECAEKIGAKAQPNQHCRSPLLDERGRRLDRYKRAFVLGVVAPGAPYFEDSESRRRLRYAVVAGLQTGGFHPIDSQHIGYFRPKDNKRAELPEAMPYEFFENAAKEPVLVIWIDEDILTGAGARNGGALKRLEMLSNLICPVEACSGTQREKWKQQVEPPRFSIVGPVSSDAMRNLGADGFICYSEADKTVIDKIKAEARLPPLYFYSYSATQSERTVSGSCSLNEHQKLFNYFYRTISDDRKIKELLADELNRRGVTTQDNIVVLSDSDTLFGRNISEGFGKSRFNHVHQKKYLRGLDGIIAAKSDKDKKDDKDQKLLPEADLRALELPFGQSQFDYVQRQAEELTKLDENLRIKSRTQGGATPAAGQSLGFKAIGVLGNDAFDKLLLLRALRPRFPEAVFFTTDFDQTLATPRELNFSRNLIVASTYGPKVDGLGADELAPFRSGYDTSAFIATRLALNERTGAKDETLRSKIDEAKSSPKIFEIDRFGAFVELPTPPAPRKTATAPSSEKLQPDPPPIYPILGDREKTSVVKVGILLAAAIFLSWWNGLWWEVATFAPFALIALFLGGASFAFYWDDFVKLATIDGRGEPLSLASGISMWPPVGLRIIGLTLSLVMILDGWRHLVGNLRNVIIHLGYKSDKKAQLVSFLSSLTNRPWDLISYDLLESPKKDPRAPLMINDIMPKYLLRSSLPYVLIRVSCWVIFIYMIYNLVCLGYGSEPNAPWRFDGGASRWVSVEVWRNVTSAFVIVLLFLVFLTVDATILCLRFVTQLRDNKTIWPDDVKRKFVHELSLTGPLLDEWIDLQFIAKRTNCISVLIYLPFISFAILIFSRSTIFAPFAPHPAIFVTQSMCFVILFGCALALCFRAKQAQEIAKEKLRRAIMSVQGKTDSAHKSEQFVRLIGLIENLHEGSFVPLSEQPPIRALLLPLGSIGWTALLEYRLIPGL